MSFQTKIFSGINFTASKFSFYLEIIRVCVSFYLEIIGVGVSIYLEIFMLMFEDTCQQQLSNKIKQTKPSDYSTTKCQ